MYYKNIRKGRFISRSNRFIAEVEVDGSKNLCHVKNTGRCRELLIESAEIFVQFDDKAGRKTKYSLINVIKGKRLINIDSQAPNKIFYEWILKDNLFKNIEKIKPEYTYKNSRFDFYVKTSEKDILIEIKGATLEENGVVLFPDAPTERGLKHIYELCDARLNGYDSYIIFIIQMKDVLYLSPNFKTHKAFGDALLYAESHGVNVLAFDCIVTENSIDVNKKVNVILNNYI
ncbi:MAG: sfsA [Clostridia bacterium]|nr:sfsA [Clostridia bacterium]